MTVRFVRARNRWLFGVGVMLADGVNDTIHRVAVGFGPWKLELAWWVPAVRRGMGRAR